MYLHVVFEKICVNTVLKYMKMISDSVDEKIFKMLPYKLVLVFSQMGKRDLEYRSVLKSCHRRGDEACRLCAALRITTKRINQSGSGRTQENDLVTARFVCDSGTIRSCRKFLNHMSPNEIIQNFLCRKRLYHLNGCTCKKSPCGTVIPDEFHLENNWNKFHRPNPPSQFTWTRRRCPFGQVLTTDNGHQKCVTCPKRVIPSFPFDVVISRKP